MLEQHYTPREVAAKLAVSYRTVMRWFADDPRCLRFGESETLRRRQYKSVRIPESVLLDFIHKSSKNPA
jgi:hypothetical protein